MPIDRMATRRSNESFRYYFIDPVEYFRAMDRAAKLEAIGCPRRAWRVRMNLDGPQPTYAPALPGDELEAEGPPPPKVPRTCKRIYPPRDRKMEYARRMSREAERNE